MLRKLLKHDFKPIWRFWWILAAVSVFASLIASLLIRYYLTITIETPYGEMTASQDMTAVFSMLFAILLIIAIVVTLIIVEVLIFWRFYTGFFSDEGYLTFTLPVRRSDLLLSKILNAMIWTGLETLLIIGCFSLFMLFVVPGENTFFDFGFFTTLGKETSLLSQSVGGWGWLTVFALSWLLILVGFLVFYICLIYYCITLGSILVKKAKFLAGIGVYYLITMVLGLIAQALLSLLSVLMAERFELLLADLTFGAQHFALLLVYLIIASIAAALASIMYSLTLGTLERRLNLS